MDLSMTKQEVIRMIEELDNEQLLAKIRLLLKRKRPQSGKESALPNSLTEQETTLLSKINKGLPTAIQTRYTVLLTKLSEETLTPPEHKELLELTPIVEARAAERLQALQSLAAIRCVSVPSLMVQLGIEEPSPPYEGRWEGCLIG